VQAGHRELVLLLAQVYPRPAVDAGNKTGMWSTSRSIVAYYSDEVLSLNSSRNLKAIPSAKKNRFRVGLNEVRKVFCACLSCCAPSPDKKPSRFGLRAVLLLAEEGGTRAAGKKSTAQEFKILVSKLMEHPFLSSEHRT